jgi:uncharacterized membrane protein
MKRRRIGSDDSDCRKMNFTNVHFSDVKFSSVLGIYFHIFSSAHFVFPREERISPKIVEDISYITVLVNNVLAVLECIGLYFK